MARTNTPVVKNNHLKLDNVSVQVGSEEWYEWLDENIKFKYKGREGHFLAQCEKRRNKTVYWYAYRRRAGKLSKVYLGKADKLTKEHLEQVSISLAEIQFSKQDHKSFLSNSESRIDNSFLPKTKVNAPVLPQKLLSRPRLTEQINSPLALIYAPSGFGKSTLINDWKQTCGFPVAWLVIDKNDNHPTRFWYSLVMALQTVNPRLGRKLFNYLRLSSSSILNAEIVSLLTNDIALMPKFGLVIDDFHHIHNSQIFDFLQSWLEQFPPNLQLILSGHIKPPLALGNLRAKCMVTEIETNNLRFTLEEGINYLLKYPQDPPLAHDDMEKLVEHTEGWAAGLMLTALALGKQDDRRQFIDTFSGAHIYFREYFMEAVLHRLSPEVRSFLLKTSIVKHLTGSLCDALTGQKNGQETLSRLWNENLFVSRLNERGMYRYHDLFAEMLYDQLQARNPNEISTLHRKAAKWYNDHLAPADAISHLIAAKAWEEAAALIEETALRELEQFGEDSRLLRWLLELPENVVQQHKTLFFVYLQLANVALPKNKIERFITHIETNITQKSTVKQTQSEREVLEIIHKIRKTWEQGNTFISTLPSGKRSEMSWQLLNSLHILRTTTTQNLDEQEDNIYQFYELAKSYKNLFVILMAGGGYARRMTFSGRLNRSEKIAHQVLQLAITLRGSLPEPASIPLTALSRIHLERYELELANTYLSRAIEVDPNPTSTNGPVTIAILRSMIQLAKGKGDDALITLQSTRELHAKRPSGQWTDSDLIAYEAMVCVRKGDVSQAEQLLDQTTDVGQHPLSDLVRAECFLAQEQYEVAEQLLYRLILQNPVGIQEEPNMGARVMLALALFKQHKVNPARQVMAEAVRLAETERFFRPFIEFGDQIISILKVVLQTEKLTSDAQAFIKEIFKILENVHGGIIQVPEEELIKLSTAALITPREQDVLRLLGDGQSNREISASLYISESTVKTHLGNIYSKLSVNNRVQATTCAKELHLI
jgi:LuxR family maltose regulon positive regulatory protein